MPKKKANWRDMHVPITDKRDAAVLSYILNYGPTKETTQEIGKQLKLSGREVRKALDVLIGVKLICFKKSKGHLAGSR